MQTNVFRSQHDSAQNNVVKFYSNQKNQVRIFENPNSLPIEVTIVGKFPIGTGRYFLDSALATQSVHPEFIDEFNEPSALIGKTNFTRGDPTAIYTFGVDVRDLVFHRHKGHRVITGITGRSGCLLKFSLCTPDEAKNSPENFLKKMFIVKIPADRLFVLRFNGEIYHQFCPVDYSENAFFAVSVHTDEAKGLSGELLDKVLQNKGSIPLLTEPVSSAIMNVLSECDIYEYAKVINLDIQNL